jgi:peptidoglycan/LPS O-acetylase OafA/YrhL
MLTWVIPFYVYYNGFDPSKITYKYILGCEPSQLWFLPMLFILFVMFYHFLDEKYISTKGMIVVIIISIGGGELFDIIDFNFFQIATAIKYAGYYYLGAYLSVIKTDRKWTIALTGLGSVVFYLIFKATESIFAEPVYLRLLESFSSHMCTYMEIIFMYYIVKRITEKTRKATSSKVFSSLREKSFGIYLFHQQIIYLLIILLNGNVPPIIQVAISFVCAVGIAYLMTAILQRFRLTRNLYGL